MDNHLFAGTVQSGGTDGVLPLASALVELYEATTGAPTLLGRAYTDQGGAFSFHNTRATTDTIFYATATKGGDVLLAAIVGTQIDGAVTINELTTVAAAFSMAQFADGSRIAGNAFGLRVASGMNDNLVSPLTGESSGVLLASPNADETIALRSTRALANMVAATVRNRPGAFETLAELTTPPGGSAPGDTFQALLNIARNPANNVEDLYSLSQVVQVYTPSLAAQPDAWTLAVKVNDSGDDAYLFGGPANVVFDANGYAWIPNNVVQGDSVSIKWIMVLKPNGQPSDGTDGTPPSPLFGGGLWGPGLGLTIDPQGSAWVGNYGWGTRDDYPPAGSVSQFDAAGNALSGPDGYTEHIHRVQATVSDGAGNIWMASYGNDRFVVYRKGNPNDAVWLQEKPGSFPFGVAVVEDGVAWVSNSAGLQPGGTSSVCRLRIQGDALVREVETTVGSAVKTIALDRSGNVWVASNGQPDGGPGLVYLLNPRGEVAGGFGGGGIDTPWGLAIDGDDNVWVANFGTIVAGSNYLTGALSVLAGDTQKNRDAGLQPGDPLSPPTGYTLPSAGSEVLLANGEPLYRHGDPCYTPLMRSTGCGIDQAGNVWVVNNWKPRFDTDFEETGGNPGGDGIVIFVGLARPPALAS
ncbi:MAG TPA: hypothetical protein VK358_02685 [Longimicrobium sp.]|nr:hypothetical protein [Longimicrobium sp.]